MENSELFRITSDRKIILKKPKIFSIINTKEIQLRNDPKNFLHSGTKLKMRQRYLSSKKVKKNDVEGQITFLSDLIDNYSSTAIKNLFLIQKLKDENDFLIEELNRNIKKNTLFNKTTKEIFSDLVSQYEKREYKIPNLTLENNLFKKSPLLIETKKDVDEFYKNNNETKGNFILDINQFPEKNWNFLRKLKKEVDLKGENNIPSNDEWVKMQHANNFYEMKKALTEKKEREKIKRDINKIKTLIKVKKNEKDDINDFYPIRNKKNDSFLNNSKHFPLKIKDLLKNKLKNKTSQKTNIYPLKILNSQSNIIKKDLFLEKIKNKKKFSKTIKGFFKKEKINGKTLITSLSQKPKNRKILSYTERLYNKINKKNLTDLDYIEDDIIQYLKNKNYIINKMNINNFNKDFSERIYDIKNKIRKQGLYNKFHHYLSDYTEFGRNGFQKLEKIHSTEKTFEKMDKYLAKHIIDKYFEE